MEKLERLVWGGSLPITFVLAPGDVAQLHPPAARYVMASRMSYLPQVAEDAIASFRRAAAPSGGGAESVWFESAGVPLKWQLPVGVLVDAVRHHTTMAKDSFPSSVSALPFQVVIHFRDFPEDKVLRCNGTKDARWAYINNLKQSACLRFGSAKKVLTGLSAAQQQQMWDAIATGNQKQFCACNVSLHGRKCPEQAQRRSIRLVAVMGTDAGSRLRNVLRPLETRIETGAETGAAATVSKEEEQEEVDDASTNTNINTVDGMISLGSFLNLEGIGEGEEGKVMIHGVEVPLDANIVDLHKSMSSADNCLYIVLSGTFVKKVL
jgi:autophagy-related protein 5